MYQKSASRYHIFLVFPRTIYHSHPTCFNPVPSHFEPKHEEHSTKRRFLESILLSALKGKNKIATWREERTRHETTHTNEMKQNQAEEEEEWVE